MNNRNFPTSTQYFLDIINSNAVYVDKTQFIVPMLAKQTSSNFFLSRPRRFGKSVFMSTIEQVFLGEKEKFKGLYIYDKIEWEKFPVIRISMDKINFFTIGLEQALFVTVQKIATTEQIQLTWTDSANCFEELIREMYAKYQKRVVVLIDEYDKPIIQYIEKGNATQAEINRDILKSFYGILKDSGKYLRFTFLTGVSKFSKVSIFSDLNYFDDMTLMSQYVTVCGFTEAELRQYCYGGLEDLAAKEGVTIDEIVDKIRYWYDGFSWNGKDFVYNPFSTMRLMDSLEFKNYWFESGTPTFLVKLINADAKFHFKDIDVESDIYNWHDLKKLDYLSIMLQTGYLTFKKSLGDDLFRVGYPNKEVENAFVKMLLGGYMDQHTPIATMSVLEIERAFKNNDIEKVIRLLKDMFKTLPSQFFQQPIERTDKQGNKTTVLKAVGENFYHAVIYLIFNILGIRMHAEVSAQEGRIDAVVETDECIYLFEFKKNRKATVALEQIKTNKYFDLYALSSKQIFMVGVSFNMQKKGISDYIVEPLLRVE